MTGKEYLLQARYLDERIHSKIQQIESLNDLATSCSAVISDMPRNPNQGGSKMADAVIKIVTLQEEINQDINALVELKHQIRVSDVVGETLSLFYYLGANCRGYEIFHAAYTPNAHCRTERNYRADKG